ncbi:PQQ-like beta-propeller repeat protein [Couchioplanes caeruleus]|uniref:PQQ-binding-like beta-propeller repeat protein n=1 Tax=Couchioplanes caeruleus TaxID=56438 RepID=UPI0020BFC249|nr:PQQ-binding-like beta-propeller repeat protein [Couchioplanes caeruleus]UQU66236.1 PQQ-like beta-propeller repeat protein [Couchioplanes caeruleus]
MPADLDQMFAALGRDADAVPLAAPEAARRRGLERSRTRALGAAVAVVAALGAGAGVSALRDAGPAPVAVSRGGPLAEVGSPLAYASPARITLTAVDAARAYAGWEDRSGGIHVAGADLHTGAPAWPERSLGRFAGLGALVAVPQAVVVTVENGGDLTGKRSAYVLDPLSGRERWHVSFTAADDVLYTGQGLVTVSARTGLTRAFDWVTGSDRWTASPAADPVVRTIVMSTPGEVLVQLTQGRSLLVRDLGTGEVIRTLPAAPRPEAHLVADGRMLYSADNSGSSYGVRAIDVTSDLPSRTIFTGPQQRQVTGLAMCGTLRLCLLDGSDAGGEPFLPDGTNTALTALHLPDGLKAWRMAAPHAAQTIEARDGRILVGGGEGGYALHDAQGNRVWRDMAPAGWLTDDMLVTLPASGVLSTVTAADGRVRALGSVPVDPGTCARTADRLACATPTSLRLWELPG